VSEEEARARYQIWFWQNQTSRLVTPLASALAQGGCQVTFVFLQRLSPERHALGWAVEDVPGVTLKQVGQEGDVEPLLATASPDSVHICQGIRPLGLTRLVQPALARAGRRYWVAMETVDDVGLAGLLKRAEYARQFWLKRRTVEGVLAIGHRTVAWVVDRGMPETRVYPFAYFTNDHEAIGCSDRRSGRFRFMFAGQFIPRKRLPFLVRALESLLDHDFELVVAGAGPDEARLRSEAEARLPGRVLWLGRQTADAIARAMKESDCLVLPSRHDGWGAVISEAIMQGTPVVCTRTCGAAGVVESSGCGGVLSGSDINELRTLLRRQLDLGRVTSERRHRLAEWGQALGAGAGAAYFLQILASHRRGGPRPTAPWYSHSPASSAALEA
jgi:glycosyltransferase involved in cell wall biosynthesis